MMTTPEAPVPATGELLRVRDVLDWPGFDVTLLTGEAGLDRPVRWAHATELVDPSPFLRGGEIILTMGIALRSEHDCMVFVDALLRSGAAAVGLAVDVVDHEPPLALARLAGQRDLALFTVPNTLPFVAFTEKLAEVVNQRRDELRQRLDDGRVIDYVRRGLASPWVLRDRLGRGITGDSTFSTVCVSATDQSALRNATLLGVVDDQAIAVVEESRISRFSIDASCSTYGLGGVARLDQLPRSLKECVAAYAMAVGHGRSMGPRDLASFSGLIERLSPDQFAPFHDHIYVPLRDHDARYGTELITTLQAFVDCDGSTAHTAAALFLHVNSVRNRLARVASVINLDPHRFEDRVTLALALHSAGRASER